MVGWREWVGLPDLKINALKAKVDTGAKTSAIHAIDVDPFEKNGASFVSFFLHSGLRPIDRPIRCEAPVRDLRPITSSNGEQEMRYIIETTLAAGGRSWPIEISLANRDQMGFRMLLGRQALREKLIVDPSLSFCLADLPDADEIKPDTD